MNEKCKDCPYSSSPTKLIMGDENLTADQKLDLLIRLALEQNQQMLDLCSTMHDPACITLSVN